MLTLFPSNVIFSSVQPTFFFWMGRKRSLEDLRREQKELGPKTKKSKPMRKRGFDEETLSEATFYVRNGLRYVKPYHFTFSAYAKGRWIGSKIYDMFCREFQAETPQFYARAFKAGKVTVNGEVAVMDRVVKNNDVICHTVHRHEPPVTAQPLKIIHEDDDIVVIDKPSSIPVHPCGRYRHNTVVFLLGKEHNLFNLRTIHRIDRLTSGLLIFAKSLARAQSLEAQIRGRELDKEYVCRVCGEFPSGTVECNEPILIVSMKLGICKVDPKGKDCNTTFMRLSYNGRTSVVRCIPKTGRMHQIRVHLQWLGYPIVNDPLYNNLAWGPYRGKEGQGIGCVDEVITKIVKSSYTSDIFDDLPSVDTGDVQLSSDVSGCALGGVSISVEDQDVREERGGGEEVCQGQDGLAEGQQEEGRDSTGASSSGGTKGSSNEEDMKDARAGCNTTIQDKGPKDGGCSPEYNGTRDIKGGAAQSLPTAVGGEFDPECSFCRQRKPDPTPHQLVMYLHALSYKGPDWEYRTELPAWSADDWKEEEEE